MAPLPSFLIIGAQKSGTHWLRENLGAHPDIFTGNEIWFFNNRLRYQDLGPDWYRAQFAGWNGERFVGESSPGYMFWRHHPEVIARRIHETVPDVRLIAILRNPVDRAQSAMIHHMETGRLPRDTDLVTLVRSAAPEEDPLGIISGGWYAASLQPYVDMFGDQLLVLLHDELSHDPRRVYQRALHHVGAAPHFIPPEIERVRFSFRQDPSTEPNRQALDTVARRELRNYFADDLERLEALLGRDLTAWSCDG